jgi:hypothetical protein
MLADQGRESSFIAIGDETRQKLGVRGGHGVYNNGTSRFPAHGLPFWGRHFMIYCPFTSKLFQLWSKKMLLRNFSRLIAFKKYIEFWSWASRTFPIPRSTPMKRSLPTLLGLACALFAVMILALGNADAGGKTKKNQMVKGTIKLVDPAKNLLVVKQKLKNETVDRELSILDTTEFVIVTGKDKKEATGKGGLELLVGKEGSQVQVKCDKDVNVLKVTVKLKK